MMVGMQFMPAFIAIFLLWSVHSRSVLVKTDHGEIEGYTDDSSNSSVIQFHGIPYTQPHNKTTRWQPSVLKKPWSKTIIAKTEGLGVACPQLRTKTRNYSMSEDCLTLNIYTNGLSEKKAVMMWIHGGGYSRGAAREYEGRHLAEMDVVVVTFNYRLGILGNFDSDGDGNWENLGLHDAKVALQWIHQHIEKFGGDRNRVTVFGGSSGAMSVTQIALSKDFEGLFHRVIAESGSAVCPKLLKRNPIAVHQAVLQKADCMDSECLKQKDVDEIIDIAEEIQYADRVFPTMYSFAPYIDPVLPYDSFEVFQFYKDEDRLKEQDRDEALKRFRSVDFMTGFNSGEGSLILSQLKNLAKKGGYELNRGVNREVVEKFLEDYLMDYFPHRYTEIRAKILELYFPEGTLSDVVSEEQAVGVINAFTDILFAAPALALLDAHAGGAEDTRTYFYIFDHDTIGSNGDLPSWFKMTPHTDERMFVFGEHPTFYNLPNYIMDCKEKQLKGDIMRAWTNFAKNGVPNSEGFLTRTVEYMTNEQKYMLFGLRSDAVWRNATGRMKQINQVKQLKDFVDNGGIVSPSSKVLLAELVVIISLLSVFIY